MTLILQGTDNSVSSPAVQGGTAGTTTGVYYPASNQLALATNGTLALLVDSSQNVYINTSVNNVFDQVAASRPLVVQKSDTSTTIAGSTASITIVNGSTTTNNTAQLNFAAITGASTNQYSSAVISTIFGARTNGQYPTGQLVFSTSTSLNAAPTEKMRITNNGTVILTNGSTSATGIGITFPATQDSSSDVNTLDDYEEGTFTPTIYAGGSQMSGGSGSYIGTYTKIGRMVSYLVDIGISSIGTGSGGLQIRGMPFTVTSGTNAYPVPACESEWLVSAISGFSPLLPPGTTYFDMYYNWNSTGGPSGMTFSQLKSNSGFRLTGVYFTS